MDTTNPTAPDTTADLLAYLDARGVKVRNFSTGAIELTRSGTVAFVAERAGKIKVTHQSSRGTSYQRFTSRERALASLLTQ